MSSEMDNLRPESSEMEESSPARCRMRPQSPGAAEAGILELESLPPEQINEILCRLPLRDAVRTSALARAWRRRWESAPSLSFEWDARSDQRAIHGVLRRYSCPVRAFRHSCVPAPSFRRSDCWLRLLARRGVQSLDLDFDGEEYDEPVHTLHPSIFSCRSLTALELQCCNVPATPQGFAGLPNLTVLSLRGVGFPEGARGLELLIATSPLLESLSLSFMWLPYRHSDGDYDPWVIQAPKLRSIYIHDSSYQGWQINDLPSLEKADLDFPMDCADSDLLKFMTALAHARKIEIVMPIVNYNALERLSRPFDNLKSLSLLTSLCLLSSVSSLFCLLRNAPKLEVLDIKLEVDEDDSEFDEIDGDFLNAQWTEDLFSSLRCVHVRDMMCKLSEMHFIEFVLSKGRQLQELHVSLGQDSLRSNEDTIIELVKYRRASPRAKVFFNGA